MVSKLILLYLLHNLTVPSFEDEASTLQSGFRCNGSQAILVIHYVCPFNGLPINLFSSKSQMQILPSMAPVAKYNPFGDH